MGQKYGQVENKTSHQQLCETDCTRNEVSNDSLLPTYYEITTITATLFDTTNGHLINYVVAFANGPQVYFRTHKQDYTAFKTQSLVTLCFIRIVRGYLKS